MMYGIMLMSIAYIFEVSITRLIRLGQIDEKCSCLRRIA